MSLTSQQKTLAGKVKLHFDAVEETHPTDNNVRALHYYLWALLGTFEGELTPQEFSDLGGGGTPKTVPE